MSGCNFSIPFSAEPSEILAKVKSAIQNQNGMFAGDENAGAFEVTVFSNTVKGNYQVTGQVMNITILDKPFFVPCSTIEGFLRGKLS